MCIMPPAVISGTFKPWAASSRALASFSDRDTLASSLLSLRTAVQASTEVTHALDLFPIRLERLWVATCLVFPVLRLAHRRRRWPTLR